MWGNLWHEGWKSWDGERSHLIGIVWCGSLEVWMVRWEITWWVSGGDIWLGLSPLELWFLLMGMFWMHLGSKWLLFFTFCSTTSYDMIEVPCCRTRVENYIVLLGGCMSRSLTMDLIFIFISYFIFIFLFFSFLFLFLEWLGLGVISRAVTSVTTWWCSHKTGHGI